MDRDQVIALMASSKSETEWSANIDKVRAAFGGQYPDFWYEAVIQSGLQIRVAERSGMSADMKVTTEEFRPLALYSRPTSMPVLQKGEKVIGIYDQGLGEQTAVCDSLADMQQLYDSYARGMALRLRWQIATTSVATIPAV